MKFKIIMLLMALQVFAYTSCKKEHPLNRTINTPTPVPPPAQQPRSNQSIWVDANMNITIEQPMNFVMLNGAVTGPGRNNVRVGWQQLTGPAGFIIENPDSVRTKVSKLIIGIYKFQITATTSTGESMSDTMTVTVQYATSASGQILFSNLDWVCPFGCSISIGDITPFLPASNTFSIYIRREGLTTWDLVVPDTIFSNQRYFYSMWWGQVLISENTFVDATDHPEVKVVF